MDNIDIKKLYKDIKKCLVLDKHHGKLPSNCYYLQKNVVLALDNPRGDARHPYSVDGLTLWAYSSGYITINQSNFYVIPMTLEGKEPYLAFFAGVENKNKKYDFFSLTGVSDSEFGRENVEKYTVFFPTSVVYLRVFKRVIYSLQISVNLKKEVIATIRVTNNSNNDVNIYTSSFFNPLLTHSNYESEETKWFRRCVIEKDQAEIYSVEDLSREIHLHNYAVIKRAAEGNISTTSSRMLYVGNKNGQLSTSSCLINGKFVEEKQVSQFIDSAVYGDIIKNTVKKGESVEASYRLSLAFSNEELQAIKNAPFDKEYNDNCFKQLSDNFDAEFNKNKNALRISFQGLHNTELKDETLNMFLSSVIEQVDYCSKAKNSSLMMLGIRDVAQMLEASLMWNHKFARSKIVTLFNYIEEGGRTPRQVSPFDKQGECLIDGRQFIDQGQWLISLVYKYLCYTNDFSILKEKCGYIKVINPRTAVKVDKVDTLFDHLQVLMRYFINNLASDTGCLRTLFGDWNDAVDGLGVSLDSSREYGDGVSIMASFHMYMNLKEMSNICEQIGINHDEYDSVREKLFESIKKHGVVSNGKEKRIVHGWGDKKSFYVGSFKDVDGKDRHSSTSNSFYAISGYYEKDPSLKNDVLNAFKKLDGKYGLMTFDIPFDREDASKVGRIVNLPKGTAENAATYIHAGIYAIKALGIMDEGELAYSQMLKLIPLTHKEISTSPFVMPNSYGYNPELGIDGQSMNDWYTGSSNTLLKAIVDGIIGVVPNIDNTINIKPIRFPVDQINLEITIKNRRIKLLYLNKGNKTPTIMVNGQKSGALIDLNQIKDKTINVEVNY